MMTVGSIMIGGLLGVIAACGLMVNFLVLIAMIKSGFLAAGSNVMYIMAFNLLISDTVQLAVNLFYQAPTYGFQNEKLFPTDVDLKRPFGFMCLWMWNNGGTMLALLSLNRIVQICYPSYLWLFTRKKTIALCLIVWLVCFMITMTAQYIVPCCELVVSYRYYSFHYLPLQRNATNYAQKYIDSPLYCFYSAAAISSYFVIFCKVRGVRYSIGSGLSAERHNKRRMKEYRFALQFLAITAFYTITWISFRIYPLIIPKQEPKWFSLIAVTYILNAAVNAWIYVIYNPDIRKACKKLLGIQAKSPSCYSLTSDGKSMMPKETNF